MEEAGNSTDQARSTAPGFKDWGQLSSTLFCSSDAVYPIDIKSFVAESTRLM